MFLLTLIFWSSLNLLNIEQPLQCVKEKKVNTFESYLSNFQMTSLPLKFDRKSVFELSSLEYDSINLTYKKSIHPEIGSKFVDYIPTDLKNEYLDNSFRCIFLLPKSGDFIPVIIAIDHFQDDVQNNLDLFVVLYKNNGECQSYMKIAGYKIDISEKFSEIGSDYSLITKEYLFKDPPTNNHPSLFYLTENQNEYKIEEGNIISKKQPISKTGYFEGNWSGYFLVEK